MIDWFFILNMLKKCNNIELKRDKETKQNKRKRSNQNYKLMMIVYLALWFSWVWCWPYQINIKLYLLESGCAIISSKLDYKDICNNHIYNNIFLINKVSLEIVVCWQQLLLAQTKWTSFSILLNKFICNWKIFSICCFGLGF